MTRKMQEIIAELYRRGPERAMDIHARTAWALQERGFVTVDGAAAGRRVYNGNYLSCIPTSKVFNDQNDNQGAGN